jgi:hypothetical protein
VKLEPADSSPVGPKATSRTTQPLSRGRQGLVRIPTLPAPSSIDRSSADTVAVVGARAIASADTLEDHNPNQTAARAGRLGWLTPLFAHRVQSAVIVGSSGAQWARWTLHRAFVVATARLSGDDHPPDTRTTAARMVVLTVHAVGRDGWRDHQSTEVVSVVLKKIHGFWRIDSDQRI